MNLGKKQDENMDDIQTATLKPLKVDQITMTDIDIAHRLGRLGSDGDRGVLCRFVGDRTKVSFYGRDTY